MPSPPLGTGNEKETRGVPLKGLLSGARKGGIFSARSAARAAGNALTDTEKLAMLDELESSGLGWFWASDAQGNLTYLSGVIADRIEVEMDDLIGKPLASLFDPAGGDERTQSLSLKLGARKSFSNLSVTTAKFRSDVVIRLSGRPIFRPNGKFDGFRGTGTDITEQYHREEETARLAKFDSLTGLSNRHRMSHIIESTITAFRASKRNVASMTR